MAWTSSRIKITVWALASLFLVGLLLTAGMLAWTTRQTALENRVEQVTRFVSGAEAALNNSFLTIDLLLSGSDDLLGLSASMVDWVDTSGSGKLLDTVTRGNLLVSHTALLDREGRVLASSDAASARNAVQLPSRFFAGGTVALGAQPAGQCAHRELQQHTGRFVLCPAQCPGQRPSAGGGGAGAGRQNGTGADAGCRQCRAGGGA